MHGDQHVCWVMDLTTAWMRGSAAEVVSVGVWRCLQLHSFIAYVLICRSLTVNISLCCISSFHLSSLPASLTLSFSLSIPVSLSLCGSPSCFPCSSAFLASPQPIPPIHPPLGFLPFSLIPSLLRSPQVTIPSPPIPSFVATSPFPPTDPSSCARSCWVWTRTSRWVMGGGRGRVIESHGGCGRGRAGG